MSDERDDARDDARDDDAAAPRPQTRREFIRVGVVGAIAVSAGCAGEPGAGAGDAGQVEGSDAASLDGGARDGGSATADSSTAPDASAADAGSEEVPRPELVPESSDFDLGVASGDATASEVIVWAHHAGSAALELVVWEMDGDAYARVAHASPVTPDADGYAHVDVSGLTAGAWHRYAFFEVAGAERSARSAIGSFRSALAADTLAPLRIGAVSCTSNSRVPAPLAHAGARGDLDLFVWLGDTTYNDGAESLDEYRARWIENVSKAQFRAVRAATSCLATWDDHEFDNDWNPETFDEAQRAAAIRTFFEHQPLRRDPAAPDRIWKRMRWGATLEVFALDCRSERLPSTRRTASAQYLSREQMDWLKAGLVESDAVFKLILNSVPIGDQPGLFDLSPTDRWEGYAAARTEILSHIDDEGVSGVLWLAGDFHLASAGRVSPSGPGASQIEILAGPGAQTGNPLAFKLRDPQFDFSTTTNNYTVLDFDPERGTVRASWVDEDGSVIETIEYTIA